MRTTGVGSAGIGIVRALSAETADVLRDLVEELAGQPDDAMVAGA